MARTRAICAVAGVMLLAGCGSGGGAGALSASDRNAAQAALSALHGSNIPLQLITISETAEEVPAACRVNLESAQPATFRVYVFWVPFLGSESYTWLDMSLTNNAAHDRFHLGTAQPVLPGAFLSANGRQVDPLSLDMTLLSLYGKQQAAKNHQVLMAHAGDAFSKPGANCQVLMNGDLRLLPNP